MNDGSVPAAASALRSGQTAVRPASDARRGRRRRRAGTVLAALIGLAALGGGWGLPNIAGPAFVEVGALVAPSGTAGTPGNASAGAATWPTVTIAGRSSLRTDALAIGVQVVNHYPLSVVLGVRGMAFQAAAYRRDDSGLLQRVWSIGVDDPALEEGSDSPAGGGQGAAAAALVPPGTSRHELTSSGTAFRLVDPATGPLPAGVYYLRVWAYGIASRLVPIALDGATDPLGVPADVPPPFGAINVH